eukprot:CAMPEP_0172853210 /NCGR_PEP_ID=MMETSP1075-20121228/56357_1 /TAXON_ID=2916 /ORGANISM="Ceratium fusus, Strain PA161109" /LENGTH=40 /DNA_ID= /DNA_START= /DNA_END= /DNA_ORIENTATION=
MAMAQPSTDTPACRLLRGSPRPETLAKGLSDFVAGRAMSV